MLENCFHKEYMARKLPNKALIQIKSAVIEVTISFLRDRTFEEEFFLVIEHKDFNPKTGSRDRKLVAVDDI